MRSDVYFGTALSPLDFLAFKLQRIAY